jgi:hypothetical protein
VTVLLRVRKVLGSNLGPETAHPDSGVFREFVQSLQAHSSNNVRPPPTISIPVH